MTDILHKITVIYSETRDADKVLGYPFSRQLTNIAEVVLNSGVAGQIALNAAGTMLLLWRRPDGRWRLELSHLYNRYSKTIATVHEYFRKEGLMAYEPVVLFE